MRIVCMIDNEDYWNLDSIAASGGAVETYGYRFIAEDPSGAAPPIMIAVAELANAAFSAGFIVRRDFGETDLTLCFICQQSPSAQIPVDVKMSGEEKKARYEGGELQRIEYVGMSLEKFYENKGAKFYLLDLRGEAA